MRLAKRKTRSGKDKVSGRFWRLARSTTSALVLLAAAQPVRAQEGTAEIELLHFAANWNGGYQPVTIPEFPASFGQVLGVRSRASASGVEDFYFLFGESLAWWLGLTSLQLEFSPVAHVYSPDMQWLTGPVWSGNFLWNQTGPLYYGFGPTTDSSNQYACAHTGGQGVSFPCSGSADTFFPLPYGRIYGGDYNLFGGVGYTSLRFQMADGSWADLGSWIPTCGSYLGSHYSLDLYVRFTPPSEWMPSPGFSNLGGQIDGSCDTAPMLMVDGTREPGAPLFLATTGACPGARGFLVASMPTTTPPLFGTPRARHSSRPVQSVVIPITANGSGQYTSTYPWPSNLPAGSSYRLQAWFRDPSAPLGFCRSNAVEIDA